jgi:AhpD family alkylhydroperoxidase
MTTTESTVQIPVRLDFEAHAAGFARALSHLDRAATKELDRVEFDPKLRELVRIRASQLNGCAYCVDMHTKDARAIGETEQRLYAVSVWRETPFFSERERAALALTEAMTLLPAGGVPDDVYAAAAEHFDEDELGQLMFAIIVINAWNRVGVGTKMAPALEPAAA